MLRRATPASSTHVPANSRPFDRMHRCLGPKRRCERACQRAPQRNRAALERRLRRSLLRLRARHHGIGIGPVGIGEVRPGAGSYLKAPKPAATSAYLTASEIFPLETRALAIAFFYAMGTAIGGSISPLLFGWLIESESAWRVSFG